MQSEDACDIGQRRRMRAGTITVAKAIAESKRCLQCNEPNCIGGCPLGISIPSVLAHCSAGDMVAAAAALREKNPFPSITGRLCPSDSLCEKSCLLHRKGTAIRIKAIESLLGDLSASSGIKRASPKPDRFLVVGSGPVGLIVAHDLFAEGYGVEVWEANAELGGCLRGVHKAPLHQDVIDNEIQRMGACGIRFARGKPFIDAAPALHDFKGVVLAVGNPPFSIPRKIALSKDGRILINDCYETSVPRVFAVGGAVSAFRSVTEAMASGRDFVQKLALRVI